MQRGGDGEDGDLPPSLPSYAPPSSSSADIPMGYASGDTWRPPFPFAETQQRGTAARSSDSSRGPEASSETPAVSSGELSRLRAEDAANMNPEQLKQIMHTPDILTIYQKLQEEDDRRQRRLERNRASARVRREKKRSVIETYEAEVADLEKALGLLNKHTFGQGCVDDLKNALEYGSGEHQRHARMGREAKMSLLKRILGQHSLYTKAIERANLENQALIAAVLGDVDDKDGPLRELELSEDQCRRLRDLAALTQDEARKLRAIDKCFTTLRAHDWLYFGGTESTLQQMQSHLSPQQFQKYLAWAVENKERIDHLEIMAGAPTTSSDVPFEFPSQ